MNTWISQDLELHGQFVDLLPLSHDHAGDLAEAVAVGDIGHDFRTSTPPPEEMEAEISRRLHMRADGEMVPFVVVEKQSGRAIGMTSYYDMVPAVPRLSIGYTWYGVEYQGTKVNPESKLLLLDYAFELGCKRVSIQTKWSNAQSRRAIEKLGLKCDGVLRQWAVLRNGLVDDQVIYSALPHEWPTMKAGLEARVYRK